MAGDSLAARAERAVLDRARGVLAERFGVEIAKADSILIRVARAQQRSVSELAAAVVESCTSDTTPLPKSLYANNDKIDAA